MKTFKYRRRGTIPFELEVTDEAGKVTTERFMAIGELEAPDLLTVNEIATKVEAATDDAGKINLTAEMYEQFFGIVLPPEELERFMATVGSKQTIIQMQTLSDVMIWLIEETTGRPTEQPSPS